MLKDLNNAGPIRSVYVPVFSNEGSCSPRGGLGRRGSTGCPLAQRPVYIERQLAAFPQGFRRNDVNEQMRTIARQLTPDEMHLVAEFYGTGAAAAHAAGRSHLKIAKRRAIRNAIARGKRRGIEKVECHMLSNARGTLSDFMLDRYGKVGQIWTDTHWILAELQGFSDCTTGS